MYKGVQECKDVKQSKQVFLMAFTTLYALNTAANARVQGRKGARVQYVLNTAVVARVQYT